MINKTTAVLFCTKVMNDAANYSFNINSVPKYCRVEYMAMINSIRNKGISYHKLYATVSNLDIDNYTAMKLLNI